MKIRLLPILFFFCCFIHNANSQDVDIPDADFLQALIDEGVDANNDGVIQYDEAEFHRDLFLIDYSFESLVGIEAFVHLKRLTIESNDLIQQVALRSNNKIDHLRIINCSGLESIRIDSLNDASFMLIQDNNSLDSITVSNTLMDKFDIINNISLTQLNILGPQDFKRLTIEANNSLTDLDFSGLRDVERLVLKGNNGMLEYDFTGISYVERLEFENHSGLNILNLTTLARLDELLLVENPSLTSVVFNPNSTMKTLECSMNQSLSELDFTGLNQLTGLTLRGNNVLSNVDFTALPSLISLNIYDSPQFVSLDLSSLAELQSILFLRNTALEEIVFSSSNAKLSNVMINECTALTDFDLTLLSNLGTVSIKGSSSLPSIDFTGLVNLYNIVLHGSHVMTDIEIKNLPALRFLQVLSNIELSNIELQNLPSLEILEISNSWSLEEFNLIGFPALSDLNFNRNKLLNDIHLDNLPALRKLIYFQNDVLESIQLENFQSLDNVLLNGNLNLTSVKLNNLISMSTLRVVNNNRLPALDLSGLTTLNDLQILQNHSLKYLNVMGLPSFVDFEAPNHNFQWICADPGQEDWLASNIDLTGVVLDPTCDFTDIQDFRKLELTVQYEQSGGCDENSEYVERMKFDLHSIMSNFSFTIEPMMNLDGVYEINLPPHEFSIQPILENQEGFVVEPNPVIVSIDTSVAVVREAICLQSSEDTIVDLSGHVLPLAPARAGFEAVHQIVLKNEGNYPMSGGFVYKYDAELIDFVSSDQPVTLADNEVQGVFEDLLPFESRIIDLVFRFNSPMDTPPLNGGEFLTFTLNVLSMDTAVVSFFHLEEEVINSVDPNDKTCLQGKYLLDDMIGEYVTYRIRFENTGNGEAVNVRVIDAIDPDVFDISTLRVVKASHPVTAQIVDDEVAFLFDDIYLPYQDSINDGYVFFEVKTWDDLELETELENTAEIYFDFNFPIKTNTTNTIVATDMDGDGFVHLEDCDDENAAINPDAEEIPNNGVDEDCDGEDFSSTRDLDLGRVNIFPNPCHGQMRLEVDGVSEFHVTLYNALGSRVKTAKNSYELDISSLPQGAYIVEIVDESNGAAQSKSIMKL